MRWSRRLQTVRGNRIGAMVVLRKGKKRHTDTGDCHKRETDTNRKESLRSTGGLLSYSRLRAAREEPVREELPVAAVLRRRRVSPKLVNSIVPV